MNKLFLFALFFNAALLIYEPQQITKRKKTEDEAFTAIEKLGGRLAIDATKPDNYRSSES